MLLKEKKKSGKCKSAKKKSTSVRVFSGYLQYARILYISVVLVLFFFFLSLVGNLSDAPVHVAAVWKREGMLYILYIYKYFNVH